MKDNEELKQLESELETLQLEADATKARLADLSRTHQKQREEIATLTDRIDKIKKGNKITKVSDHAIVRYLERVSGFNIDLVRDKIVTEDIIELAAVLGADGKMPHKDGFTVVVKDSVVVTII